MKKLWAVCAVLAVSCMACSDDDDSSSSCVEGTKSCTAAGLVVCEKGIEVTKPCGENQTCDPNLLKCVTNSACTGAEPQTCENNSAKYCNTSGQWAYTACGNKTCQVENGVAKCVASDTPTPGCTEGAEQCSLAGVHQVCSNGKWVDDPCCVAGDAGCASACVDGKCKSSCTTGEKRCGEDSIVQTCTTENGKSTWKTTEACDKTTQACSNGQCVDKSSYVPEVGKACGDFESKCDGSTFYYCNPKGVVAKMDCSSSNNSACVAVDGVDECLIDYEQYRALCNEPSKLTPNGAIVFSDSCDTEYKTLVYAVCVTADNGKVYNEFLYADSICYDDHTALSCSGAKMLENTCSTSCTDVEKVTALQNDSIAVCDGKELVWTEGSSSSGDDTIFDCSDETSGGQTLLSICKEDDASNVMAICMECSSYFYCIGSEYTSAVGQSGTALGMQCDDESGSGTDELYYCGDDSLQLSDGSTKTGKQICAAHANTVAICDSESIYCLDACTTVGASQPFCGTADSGTSMAVQMVCTDIDGQKVYDFDYSTAKICKNACKADSTDCDSQGYME